MRLMPAFVVEAECLSVHFMLRCRPGEAANHHGLGLVMGSGGFNAQSLLLSGPISVF